MTDLATRTATASGSCLVLPFLLHLRLSPIPLFNNVSMGSGRTADHGYCKAQNPYGSELALCTRSECVVAARNGIQPVAIAQA
jgi:hypothetical protein